MSRANPGGTLRQAMVDGGSMAGTPHFRPCFADSGRVQEPPPVPAFDSTVVTARVRPSAAVHGRKNSGVSIVAPPLIRHGSKEPMAASETTQSRFRRRCHAVRDSTGRRPLRARVASEPCAVTKNASAFKAVSYRGTLSFGTPMPESAAPRHMVDRDRKPQPRNLPGAGAPMTGLTRENRVRPVVSDAGVRFRKTWLMKHPHNDFDISTTNTTPWVSSGERNPNGPDRRTRDQRL